MLSLVLGMALATELIVPSHPNSASIPDPAVPDVYLSQTKVSVPTYIDGATATGSWYRDDLYMGSDEITFDCLFSPTGSTPGRGKAHGILFVSLTAVLGKIAPVMKKGARWGFRDVRGRSLRGQFPLGCRVLPHEH